jgi:hypothetical protein
MNASRLTSGILLLNETKCNVSGLNRVNLPQNSMAPSAPEVYLGPQLHIREICSFHTTRRSNQGIISNSFSGTPQTT